MSLWNGLSEVIEADRSLSELTSMRTGGAAKYFCEPKDPAALEEVLDRCREHGIEVRFMGGATNVVVTSASVDAMVVRIHAPAMTSIGRETEKVTVGAGRRMERLTAECAEWGLTGLEFMASVPGTVGGAIASGASTRGGRFRDMVCAIETVGPGSGPAWNDGAEIPDGRAVTKCVLKLSTDDPGNIRLRMKEEKEYRRSTQPHGVASAGCIFRNPPGDLAGRLIEQAGLKGRRVGDAEVSEIHGNYIVNTGSASGRDIRELVDIVRESVAEASGVKLEMEVDVW